MTGKAVCIFGAMIAAMVRISPIVSNIESGTALMGLEDWRTGPLSPPLPNEVLLVSEF